MHNVECYSHTTNTVLEIVVGHSRTFSDQICCLLILVGQKVQAGFFKKTLTLTNSLSKLSVLKHRYIFF